MRDERLYLRDMVESCELVESYLAGLTADDLEANVILRDAILHRLMVIGEAAGKVGIDTRTVRPQIPWALIVGFRNLLVHEYFAVSITKVWQICRTDVPSLKRELRHLLEELDRTKADPSRGESQEQMKESP